METDRKRRDDAFLAEETSAVSNAIALLSTTTHKALAQADRAKLALNLGAIVEDRMKALNRKRCPDPTFP